MKNYAQFNITTVGLTSISVVLSRYNALHFTYLAPKRDFIRHILSSCSLFFAASRRFQPIVVASHNDRCLRKMSANFRRILRQRRAVYPRYCVLRYCVKYDAICNASSLLCQINDASLSFKRI